MTINNNTYQVGDLFTTQKSAITGRIEEIVPVTATVTRVKLATENGERWTSVTLS
jgi:hypothetical protein